MQVQPVVLVPVSDLPALLPPQTRQVSSSDRMMPISGGRSNTDDVKDVTPLPPQKNAVKRYRIKRERPPAWLGMGPRSR